MAHNRHTNPPASRRDQSPRRLDPIAPVYFFTPDLECEIGKLDGVVSVRVISTGLNIEEIHVIATPDRVPKKLVRDIESLLLVRFGIRVDHRKIGIVQLVPGHTLPAESTRPRILSVKKVELPEGIDIQVELDSGGQSVQGSSRVVPGESELAAASRALIAAIEKLLNATDGVHLQEVSLVTLGQQQVVVVLLNWLWDDQVLFLVGATIARDDPLEAAARATFDALNRKLVQVKPSPNLAQSTIPDRIGN